MPGRKIQYAERRPATGRKNRRHQAAKGRKAHLVSLDLTDIFSEDEESILPTLAHCPTYEEELTSFNPFSTPNPPFSPPYMALLTEETEVMQKITNEINHYGVHIFAAYHRLQMRNPRLHTLEKFPWLAMSTRDFVDIDLAFAIYNVLNPDFDDENGGHIDVRDVFDTVDAVDEMAASRVMMNAAMQLGPAGERAFKRLVKQGRYFLADEKVKRRVC